MIKLNKLFLGTHLCLKLNEGEVAVDSKSDLFEIPKNLEEKDGQTRVRRSVSA